MYAYIANIPKEMIVKNLVIAGIIVAGTVSIASHAADAPDLQVVESVEINAQANEVWATVSNFGDLGAWHPAVKTTEIVAGTNNKDGAVRLLTLQDNGTIKEELEAYDPAKHSLSYKIIEGVLPVSHYHSTVSIQSVSGNKTKVVWSGTFKRKDTAEHPAKGQGDEDAVNTITAVYKGGLGNLKKISETH
jgi:mxaD protein